MVQHLSQADLPTRFGNFTLHVFADDAGYEHMAIVANRLQDGCLVRIHSECATGDILGSLRCDCRAQLEASLRLITASDGGMVIYLRGHEGRAIGLANKVRAYALQDKGMNTAEANIELGFPVDGRNYDAAVEILQYFGLAQIRLLTNNGEKIAALELAGITVSQRLPLWVDENVHNSSYLDTKRTVMGHLGE